MRYNAKKTFAAGNFGEAFFMQILDKAGIPYQKNPERSDKSKMVAWDVSLELDGVELTAEVKFDQMEAKTGNVAVEYFNVRQGKPSGILATKSNLWVFVLQEPLAAWACRTADLRKYFDTQPCHREIACGGDDNAAMKLYRRETLFSSIFYRVDDMEPGTLKALLQEILDGA